MELSKVVGENIQNLRKAHKMTQKDLADMFNYTANAVSKWERGETLPEISTLKTIADYFHVTVDCLLTENGYLKVDDFKNKERNKIISLIQALLGVSLVCTAVGIVFVYMHQNNVNGAWVSFIWAIPISLISPMYVYRKEKMPILKFILWSIAIWSILLAVYLQYLNLDLSLIFFIGIPAELSIVFWTKIIDIGRH